MTGIWPPALASQVGSDEARIEPVEDLGAVEPVVFFGSDAVEPRAWGEFPVPYDQPAAMPRGVPRGMPILACPSGSLVYTETRF